MYDMNSGYSGYRMSNRAVEAYAAGEKPFSKWSKADIVSAVSDLKPELANDIARLNLEELRRIALYASSWHHTSSYCNATDFYSIDEDSIEDLTVAEINRIISTREKKEKAPKQAPVRRLADIQYIVWTGTRNYPKADKRVMTDVYVEERGCFYIVFNDQGREILRKKISSNGTYVIWKQ